MELKIGPLEIRLCDTDGLTRSERRAVDSYVSSLGYIGLADFLQKNEYASARELVEDYYFSSTRDYFLGDGRNLRLGHFNNNGHE